MIRDRCSSLEQDLRVARGALAILKSKHPRPAEREAFLLEELEKANNDLLCKWPRAPESFVLIRFLGCFIFPLCAGVQQDPQAEASRVESRLRHVAEVVGRDTTSFWSDPS